MAQSIFETFVEAQLKGLEDGQKVSSEIEKEFRDEVKRLQPYHEDKQEPETKH